MILAFLVVGEIILAKFSASSFGVAQSRIFIVPSVAMREASIGAANENGSGEDGLDGQLHVDR